MKWFKRFGYLLLFLFLLINIVSAFHAYKFTHFYSISKPVKKPEQMNLREKAGAIFFGVDYPKKKISQFPSVPFDIFSVQTPEGFMLRGWKLGSVTAKRPGHAVILFHGHGGNKSGVLSEAEAFRKMNCAVYMIDFRAHGESDGDVCTIGYNEAKDVKSVYDLVKEEYGDSIVLWGISLGAATITKAMADYPGIKPEKVILEMPFGSVYDAVKGRLRTMHLPEQPFAPLLTFWGGTEQGFWAFTMSPEEYAKQVHCPVLLQWGIHDARVSLPETSTIFANLGTNKKRLVKYDAAHESLIKKDSIKWVQNVSTFLSN